MKLLPTKATFAPGEDVGVEVRNASGRVTVSLWRLDRHVATIGLEEGEALARFGALSEGGYGVEAVADDAPAPVRTALDVLGDPLSRPRYGFVSAYEPGRDTAGVTDLARRLHLNAVQFYDWMYRHATLLPPDGAAAGPDETFTDALGQEISLASVRRLVDAVHGSGSLALGYAAVYAVGREAWPEWKDVGLYRSDLTPWTLGEDFLWNVDPTASRWLEHLIAELRAARETVGFAGFHLDQYGAPKRAQREDGSAVDLARAFPALIDRIAEGVPGARLIFNNVNDFPTWSTAGPPQAATYIEVWPPHTRLTHLGGLIARARALAPGTTPILAAYLSAYQADEAAARQAERLELATAWSHGGGILLHGEDGAALTEAYYVRHKCLGAESLEATRRSYDFAVRYGDLLFDPGAVDVTRTEVGGANEELLIEAPVPVSTDGVAGAVWVRAVRGGYGLVVHLIDLSAQEDDRWDAGKCSPAGVGGVRVHVQRDGPQTPRFLYAEADASPALRTLPSRTEGRYDVVELPALGAWTILWVTPPQP